LKTLLIVCPGGVAVGEILRTDAFEILKSKILRIVILAPAAKTDSFLKEFAGGNVIVEELLPYRNKIETLFKEMRQDMIRLRYSGVPDIAKVTVELTKNPFLHYFKKVMFASFYKSDKFRSFVKKVGSAFPPDKLYGPLFAKYQPSAVFVIYPFDPRLFPALRRAAKNKVPTIAFISSWDNFTCKGEPPTRLDKLIVWNKIMKKEAMEIHGYSEDDVFISGVPKFDIYARKDIITTREEFMKKIGGDPKKKLLTYTTGGFHGQYIAHRIIETIVELIKEEKFAYPCQLLVRLHPCDEIGYYERYKGNKNVIIERPGRPDVFTRAWDPSVEDMIHLANTMKHSDVVINAVSTTTIDASCFDTPIVNIAFEKNGEKWWWDVVARYYDYAFYKNVIRTGGLEIARNKGELLGYINGYLKNPKLDNNGRKQIVEEQCYKLDGKAGERVAEHVLKFMEEVTKRE